MAESHSGRLHCPHGPLALPAFLPDATRAVVRAVDSEDLRRCGVEALVMNVFHLMQRPGSSTIKALGGLHRLSGWHAPIMTDSGGFQAYSLIRQNPRQGALTDQGITFRPEGSRRKFLLTPEKSIQLQLSYGADVVVCLDDCTHPEDPLSVHETSVRRTTQWARSCRQTFDQIITQRGLSDSERPLLFAVVQGGASLPLRRQCAEQLLDIGFDGFGFGGWPLDTEGNLLTDLLAHTRSLIPKRIPMHALGVGHPNHFCPCVEIGYQLFDSALPTRDARQGRLYTDDAETQTYRYLHIQDNKHIKSAEPVDPHCDCPCCMNYSRGYLHHLFAIRDTLAQRMATLHNLRMVVRAIASSRTPSAEKIPER